MRVGQLNLFLWVRPTYDMAASDPPLDTRLLQLKEGSGPIDVAT